MSESIVEESIVVHGYDYYVDDEKDGVNEIHIWSLDTKSQACLLRVQDFPFFCYIELPTLVDGKIYRWGAGEAKFVFDWMCRQPQIYFCRPKHHVFVEKYKLYYYRNKFPMMLLTFSTQKQMMQCVRWFSKPQSLDGVGIVRFNVWENNFSAHRKLLTACKTLYSQWFRVRGRRIEPDDELRYSKSGITKENPAGNREYIIDWKSMKPLPASETQELRSCPRILSFDIETYSDNHQAMPNSLLSNHVITMISCDYMRLGHPETRQKYGITLDPCRDVKGATIIRVKTELEQIDALAKLIDELDPEILIGYNIFSYDYPYIDVRLGSQLRSWPALSRLHNRETTIYRHSWKSSAYGHNEIQVPRTPGRISIDLLPLIRREYRLEKYGLEYVGQYFLKRGKLGVTAQEMFRIHEEITQAVEAAVSLGLKVGLDGEVTGDIDDARSEAKKRVEAAVDRVTRVMDYCLRDSELVLDLFIKLHSWIGLVELSSIMGVPIVDLFTRGQQVRCASQIYNLASQQGVVIDRRIADVVHFVGGAVGDPETGISDNTLCFDFASMYPSIIEAYNICYTTLLPPEFAGQMDEKCSIIRFEQEEPLIPKNKRERPNEDGGEGPIEGYPEETPAEGEEGKTIKRSYCHRFVRADVKKGLIPQLVHNLVMERSAVRAQLKKIDPNDLYAVVLDKRQNALKVSGNSFFGFLGAQDRGMLPLIEGAMSITALGRSLIHDVRSYVETKYGARVIYGDTDSVMVVFPQITKPEECHEWGTRITREVSGTPEKSVTDEKGVVTVIPAEKGLFPPPLRIEYEKAMRIICFKKKKYAYLRILKDGSFERDSAGELVIHKKGIVMARRDTLPYLRKIYARVLLNVLTFSPVEETYRLLVESVADLLQGKIPVQGNLSLIRELGSNYKNQNYFLKVFADMLRRESKIVSPGDRLEYVIVVDPREVASPGRKAEDIKLGYKMRSLETWLQHQAEPIDYMYYLEHSLQNALDQLFLVGYQEQLKRFEKVGYQPQNSRRHWCPITKPIQMMARGVEDYLRGWQDQPHPYSIKLTAAAEEIRKWTAWFAEHARA